MVQNPLAPLLNTARQINEQVNLASRGLGDSLTQTANSILAAASTGVPGAPGGAPGAGAAGALQLPQLPGLPGLPGFGGSHTPEHRAAERRGNPNGVAGVPGIAQLFPAGSLQPFTQLDDVIFPRGFPSPLRLLTGAMAAEPAAPVAPAAPPIDPVATRGAIGVEGTPPGVGARRPSRAIGVAAT